MFAYYTLYLWISSSRLYLLNLPCVFFAVFVLSQSFVYSKDAKDSTPKQEAIKPTTSKSSAISPFIDNKDILIEHKPVLLIFSKDDCYYCQILETSLVENASINGYLTLNFSAYLINISSSVKHNIPYLKLSGITSIDMAKLYKVTAMPYMIFISLDSEEIMRVVGFPGERRLMRILEFVNNDLWKRSKTKIERIESFLEYEEDHN